MTRLKTLSLALAVLAGAGLLFGTAGFSAVSADRGVSVAVVDDESAMIGYQSSDGNVEDGATVDLVTVANRYTGDIDVTNVSVDADGFEVDDVTEPTGIEPGANGTIEGTVSCAPGENATVAVTVTAEGSDLAASLSGDTETREFELRCAAREEEEASVDGVRFSGAGNFHVDSTGVSTTDVTYWTEGHDGELQRHGLADFDPSKNAKSQISGDVTDFVAVHFPEFDVTFVHPDHELETDAVDDDGAERVEGTTNNGQGNGAGGNPGE